MDVLLSLARHFLLMSLLAFGGGNVTLPETHRYLVSVMHWMTDQQFTALYAIAQAAPGPNMLFVALFGGQVAGLAGAVVAMLGMCGPSSLLALAVEKYAPLYREARWYRIGRRALAPITIGLLLATGYVLSASVVSPALRIADYLLCAAVALLCLRSRLNPLWFIFAGALLGYGQFV
ncbi:chromate transporter [Burkholderia glumae]|uniref:Chromate transporter n=1 Tax=Burkholderia glumae TaxID=337 RepID=A0AAP9XVM4_BURGL|nr:chromate transporter [Burkholderia glumae]ACR32261.1 Chromate transporter [Burkholderia glumae BGR1]AJY63312.1 chromate transporter family protein [Burkholderia glumae LMG 2196 = ATCC 33617]KHJ60977.1 chromate transporter [Burkholderia glumae]MCM2484549.1 chromate transporter [Burkholderia glumae]MCM2494929.1 chromate transporter [Burkholderia glumae]